MIMCVEAFLSSEGSAHKYAAQTDKGGEGGGTNSECKAANGTTASGVTYLGSSDEPSEHPDESGERSNELELARACPLRQWARPTSSM